MTRRRSLRKVVFERDGGRCAECGADMEALRLAIRSLRGRAEAGEERQRVELFLRAAGKVAGWSPDAALWHADHILPVDEGGADELANLRTLCVPCHAFATAEQAARRRRIPEKARSATRAARRMAGGSLPPAAIRSSQARREK